MKALGTAVGGMTVLGWAVFFVALPAVLLYLRIKEGKRP